MIVKRAGSFFVAVVCHESRPASRALLGRVQRRNRLGRMSSRGCERDDPFDVLAYLSAGQAPSSLAVEQASSRQPAASGKPAEADWQPVDRAGENNRTLRFLLPLASPRVGSEPSERAAGRERWRSQLSRPAQLLPDGRPAGQVSHWQPIMSRSRGLRRCELGCNCGAATRGPPVHWLAGAICACGRPP